MIVSFAGLDLLTRRFWRTVGRPIDVTGAESWLQAPAATGSSVADGWLHEEAAKIGGVVRENVPGA
ncbi:hypothetical protein, partial [Serratia marcescens]|uniref:hypothetical protein n=1 Tax=Serratia marcescens TaxID=615 RepID=UPI001C37B61E